MKNNKEIENRLDKLGELLRSEPSVIKNGMQKIEHIEQPKKSKSVSFLPALYKSGIGLAACLLIGAFLWLTTFWPASITLADVQNSIGSKEWILISYDDARKEWVNLKDRRCFVFYGDYPSYFYTGMRDHVKGIWRFYHTNWGQQINEETFDVRPYPQTPWEYAIGGWDDTGRTGFPHTIIEKVNDIIDDRNVVRFDKYSVGPLDLRVLTEQVWADPETRLPVRIRKYSEPDEFDTGDFSFPETGPSSIFDIGAPKNLKVISNWGITDPGALAIIDAGKKASHNLPKNMRIIEKRDILIKIYYQIGNKLRTEYYGKVDDNNRLLPIDYPETNDNIRQWAINNLTRFVLNICDGEYNYFTGIKDAPFVPDTYPSVEYQDSMEIGILGPFDNQWPYIGNVGPIWVVKDEPNTPPGCVLMRYEGTGVRRDWYIDTEHDDICVKKIEFHEYEDSGEFINPSETEWTNLTQLPSGQWYARTAERKGKVLEEYDVKLLSDSEIEQLTGKNDSKGFFDGVKVMKSEMDKGKKVKFWAK